MLTIVLIPMCTSEIIKSKSDLGVRLSISVKIMLMSVCSRSYVNMSKLSLSFRSAVSIKSYVDVCLQ